MKQTATTNGFPILHTPRLRLRRPKETDVPAYFALSQDENVMRYFGRRLNSEEEAMQVLTWMDTLFEQQRGIGWIIADAATDECLGDIGFPEPEYVAPHARAALSFKLAKPWWRQGLMTEAVQRVLAYGFEEFGLHRIEALVDPPNIASYTLLEKFHFVKEGILRDYECVQGRYVHLIMYALLRRDWISSSVHDTTKERRSHTFNARAEQ
jgi:[ribosomal protein S5]-alanine N-acetyltransferase